MTDYIDRHLMDSLNEVGDVYDYWRKFVSGERAAILTLATVTHHQNGMKP